MTSGLTPAQVTCFHENGFVFPIDVLSAAEVASIRGRMADVEAADPAAFAEVNRNNAHLAYDFFDEIVHHPRIADAVADLIGPDILALSTVVFAKDGHSASFVSWHQDGRYTALSEDLAVTAWVALTDSTVENGCMQMAPGTHKGAYLSHQDTFAHDNILTRGQAIDDLDTSTAVDVILKPGQMSLHHWRVAHASAPNRSKHRRIGFAVQAYIPPTTQQLEGRGFVQTVRGQNRTGNMEEVPRVRVSGHPDGLAVRDRINAQWLDQLYDGAADRRSM